MGSSSPALFLLSALLVPTLSAQSPADLPADLASCRAPIHTHPAGATGDYGWWASGRSYKVSFHDGFVFYPVLGTAYADNLPLRWTTESVTAGGMPVGAPAAPAAATAAHGDWRWEYRHQGVTEAYDVREDGVEQSFVIHERPRQAGDLVVTGRIDTRLRPSAQPAGNGAGSKLLFADAHGRPVIEYGAAVALDAGGRRTDVRTALDGDRVALTVPADWLAGAVFPVTIDPLLTRVLINTVINDVPDGFEIARHGESASYNVMIVFARAVSTQDIDVYGVLFSDDFSDRQMVFFDVGPERSANPDCAHVAGADRWVIVYEVPGGPATMRAYLHDQGSLWSNSGQFVDLGPGTLFGRARFPRVGGNQLATGTTALVVCHMENRGNSYLAGVVLDASTRSMTNVGLGGNVDRAREHPDVNNATENGRSWLVVWEQVDTAIPGDDTDVMMARVRADGSIVGVAAVGPDTGLPAHKLRPQVAGTNGRYLVAMLRNNGTVEYGTQIITERVDWADNDPLPTRLGPQVLATTNGLQPFRHLRLAYDTNTRSHWTLIHEFEVGTFVDVHVRRLGQSGGQTELQVAYADGGYAPSVTFNADASEFQLVYGALTNTTATHMYAQRFVYPTAAVTVPYGTGCGNGDLRNPNSRPYAGSEFYRVRLRGLPSGTPCVLFLGSAPASIPMAGIGMTGCSFHLAPASVFLTVPAVTSGNAAGVEVPLPDRPVFIGDILAQWLFVQPGLNPSGLGATEGLRIQVR